MSIAEPPSSSRPIAGRRGAGPQPLDGGDLHELLTVEDVAALLKVSKSWVYERTRRRGLPEAERLPHIKLGKYIRFDARAVRIFLTDKCRTT